MSYYVELNAVSKIYSVGSSVIEDFANAVKHHDTKEKYSKEKVAVNQVTLKLHEGECLGIIGRNGAGKSTLLRMITGITKPTSGKIHVNGKVTSILTLGIGLREELSGRENIYVDGEIKGKSRAEVDKVIDEVIAFAELDKFIDYPVRTYSTGMKARLAFSMITYIDPEILIIDETLSVGDAFFSAKATARILEICKRGKIVILVSHGMSAINDICNRCIYLKDGSVIMDGGPEAVTKAYIDEVKSEDEAALMVRFASHVGNQTLVPGYMIEKPVMRTGDTLLEAIRIESAKKFLIRIVAKFPYETNNLICCVRVIRLDELILFQRDFNVVDYFSSKGEHCLELEFPFLHLRPAVYRLDVELRERSVVNKLIYARSSSIFEVYSLSRPVGGQPMLYYPVSIKVNLI